MRGSTGTEAPGHEGFLDRAEAYKRYGFQPEASVNHEGTGDVLSTFGASERLTSRVLNVLQSIQGLGGASKQETFT